MTRNEFIRRLKSGLGGMPAAEQAEVVSDYEAHFDAGAAEGRSEIEIAEALGNPGRLARELRLEAGVRQWREDRSPSSAWAAVIAFMGLATIDILILLPIFLSVIGIVIALYVASVAIFVAGGAIMVVGPELKAELSDGHLEWDSGHSHGPVTARSFDFDMTRPLEIAMPVDMLFERGEAISMTAEGPKKTIDKLVYENGGLKIPGTHDGSGAIKVRIVARILPGLEIRGPANIEIADLSQPEFRLSMAGAGNIEASGKVEKLFVDASGAGNVDLASLDAVDAEISLVGLGNADINASGRVAAAIAGAGNVTLHRKPRELDSSIAGLGNVDHDY